MRTDIKVAILNDEGKPVENWEWERAENFGNDGGCQHLRMMWVNVAGDYGIRVGTVHSGVEDAGKWWYELVFADRSGRRLEIHTFSYFDSEAEAKDAATRAFDVAASGWALLP